MIDGTGENKKGLLARVGVITSDAMLSRKLELALSGAAEVVRATLGSEGGFDLVLIDKRSRAWGVLTEADGAAAEGAEVDAVAENDRSPENGAHTVPIIDRGEWQVGEHALPYPFSFGELRELLAGGAPASRLIIERDGRGVILDGERIRLTEREHALLSAIAEGGGDFVGRDELRERAFGPDMGGGILNVYIHYLREKLEKNGEKLILSSRLGGYRIDEKYLGVKK